MTFLKDLLNPPSANMNDEDKYNFYNTIAVALDRLTSVSNASQTLNPNFATLGPGGMTPVTETDGDNAQFMQNWYVVGASQATYVLTPTQYPNNSTVASSSAFYVNTTVSTYTGSGLYFYQRQMNTVRKYQQQFITFTLSVNNNQSNVIKLRFNINSNYGSSSVLNQGPALYLQPGWNMITTTLETDSLNGVTVTSGNYTEFQLSFEDLDLGVGTVNFDLYYIKTEFGQIATPLN